MTTRRATRRPGPSLVDRIIDDEEETVDHASAQGLWDLIRGAIDPTRNNGDEAAAIRNITGGIRNGTIVVGECLEVIDNNRRRIYLRPLTWVQNRLAALRGIPNISPTLCSVYT